MVVEGHTDSLPISDTRYASNWELSTQRATTVLRHLLEDGLAASRVAAAGYADQRPLKADTTAAGRARNRRVAIVILTAETTASAAGAAPAAAPAAAPVPVAPAVPANPVVPGA